MDGLISLLFMCKFMEKNGLKYSYYVNEHRKHGFTLEPAKLSGYLVIAADFTITQKEMQVLVDNNVCVLSTDHHECQDEFVDVENTSLGTRGIVINNQYPFEPEEKRYLSGAGVFYELICSIDEEFKCRDNDALVGITLLSDIRSTESDDAKKYLRRTFAMDVEKGYGKYLIDSLGENNFTFGRTRIDRNFIDYTLNPTVNAMLRFNKTKEAVNFILGYGLPIGENCRRKQQDLISVMNSKVCVQEYSHVNFICISDADMREYIDVVDIADFIGLLCSDYKDKHGNKSTFGFTISNGVVTRASFRGKYDENVPYLFALRHVGLDAHGHANAFGILNFEPTMEIWGEINNAVADIEMDCVNTRTIIESKNLSLLANSRIKYGSKLLSLNEVAEENCFVRDNYRCYIKYTGSNAKVQMMTYKTTEFTDRDIMMGLKPDRIIKGVKHKYLRDARGNLIPKYIEYLVDGRIVKSFGVSIEDGIILPILEKGFLQLQVCPNIAV